MTREHELRRVQRLSSPPAEVFEFFADARNLEAITPPFLKFRVLTPDPILMRPGALIDYRLQLFGAPLSWRTIIDEYDPPHGFVDRQLRGPYALWRHTHTFEPIYDDAGSPIATEMTDVVRYRLPLGPLGSLAHVMFVRKTLVHIFDFRRDTIETLLNRRPLPSTAAAK